jgi:hypothetical protein
MTAEEYIENIVSAHSDMRWMDASELREILNKVTDMTRKEEREKAIEIVKTAYKNALYECKTNNGTYKSPIYIFEDLMKNCDKLLNQ